MIKLGSKVKDQISGFTGIATARTEYLHGCARVVVDPQELHEGKPIDGRYFDEQQLEVVEEDVLERGDTRPGGPKGTTPPPRS